MKFINKYWYFLLFFIPMYFLVVHNLFLDRDTFFLLNTGRYIINNGIFYIDPFSMHEGLNIIVQQWLSDVIYYGIYSLLGVKGIMLFLFIMLFIISFCLYKLFYLLCNNKIVSYILMILCSSIICFENLFVSRPQIFTYLIIIIELYLLERYIKSKTNKYL